MTDSRSLPQQTGLDVDVSGLPGRAKLQFTVEADGSVHFWGFDLDGKMIQVWGTEFSSLPESEFTTYVRNLAGFDR